MIRRNIKCYFKRLLGILSTNIRNILKSSQEQAVAAWINYLNQVRLDRLIESLSKQDTNLATAMDTIETAFNTIKEDIIIRNRGGDNGMHGFIAEIAECGIVNARQNILGNSDINIWINDNGPNDIISGTDVLQQKFVQSGGHLSLRAVEEHLNRYPEYLTEGYKYQIPKDHYDKIMKYLEMPEDEANKLTSTDEFSLQQWQEVNDFFNKNSIDIDKLEPSILEYGEVQKETIEATFDNEKEYLLKVDKEQRDAIYQDSKPTFEEGMQATTVGAVIEGSANFVMSIFSKCKSGKKIKDFDESDWTEIIGESGKGVGKGGIRGVNIYLLTNFTVTPAAVASAITTAAFGIAEQAHLLRTNAINKVQFIENAEMLCLDASVSALSSFLGQIIIPTPILGAVVGNVVGTMIYQIGKNALSEKEQDIINKYMKDISDMDEKLTKEYQQYIEQLNRCFTKYMELLALAFDPKVEKALDGSVALAKYMGVSDSEILDSYKKIEEYFTT